MKIKYHILFFFFSSLLLTANAQKLKPEYSKVLDENSRETSGLLFWSNKLWTHNDDGDTNLYALDPFSGEITQTIHLENVKNNDWESISQDENYIYIGDFGNNITGNRTNLNILRIEKEALLSGIQKLDTIHFKYSDQLDFTPKKSNTTDFDGEAFIVSNDSIYIFTKQWTSKQTNLYSLSKLPGNYTAKFKTKFKVNGLITDAIFVDHKLVLSGYSKKLKPFIYKFSDFQENDFFSGKSEKIKLKLPFHQVEGIASEDGKTFFLTNEYFAKKPFVTKKQQIHKIILE